MASNINTTNIDITYPIAGQDNDTQGFRNNFTNIRNNLNIAALEITNLQSSLNSSITLTSVPASLVSPGTAGQIAYDTNNLYVCVAANNWIKLQNYNLVNVVNATTVNATGNVNVSGNISVAGNLVVGTPIGYTDTGILESISSNTAGYNQLVLQNQSPLTNASTNFNVSNNLANATANFGEFGMNSSNFVGNGAFSAPGAVYLASASTDLAIGTYSLGNIHFVVNNSATDAMTITNTGVVTLTSAIQFANLTSAQITTISTPTRGMTVYNYTTGNIQVYNGTKWANVVLS